MSTSSRIRIKQQMSILVRTLYVQLLFTLSVSTALAHLRTNYDTAISATTAHNHSRHLGSLTAKCTTPDLSIHKLRREQ